MTQGINLGGPTKFTDAWHDADEREAEQTLKRKPLAICEAELEVAHARERILVAKIIKAEAIIEGLVDAAQTGLEHAIEAANEWGKKDAVFDNIMRDIARIEAALEAAGVPKP